MKKRGIGKASLITAAVTLTAALSVGSALAYFTTYCTAEGSYTMQMGFPDTEIEEDVDENGKHISIVNTGEYDTFVRVKVFAPSFANLTFEPGEGWEKSSEDEYWYYTAPISPEAETSVLTAKYEWPKDTDPSEEVDTRPESFDIIVVYEYVPVLYDEEGNPDMTESWNNVAAIISSETSTEPDAGEEEGTTETEPGAGEDAGAEQGGE